MLHRFLKRLIAGDSVAEGGPASLRNVFVWLFIAMVAAFLTHPAGGPGRASSAFDTTAPWPAELGLDNTLSPFVPPAHFYGSSPASHSA